MFDTPDLTNSTSYVWFYKTHFFYSVEVRNIFFSSVEFYLPSSFNSRQCQKEALEKISVWTEIPEYVMKCSSLSQVPNQFYANIYDVPDGTTGENQSGAAGMWLLQPHHQYAPAHVWAGTGSPGRYRYISVTPATLT